MTRKFLTQLVLPADPAAALEAATKQYVDARVAPAWIPMTPLTTGWVNLGPGYNTAAYRKIGDTVQLRGIICNGSLGWGAFTLPAGYAPTLTTILSCASAGAYGEIRIGTGIVPYVGNIAWFSMDGLSYAVP